MAYTIEFVFEKWFKPFAIQKTVSKTPRQLEQKKREIFFSALTSLIFAFFTPLLFLCWQNGWTKVYIDVNDYPLWYMPISLALAMLVHETYYYWLHRFMHLPRIYRWIHKVHHDSITNSVWTAFSFHPFEALLQIAIFFPIIIFIPLHPFVIIIQLILMTISSFINHLNIEVYRPVDGKWLIGATHHGLHHLSFKTNYGLYFTFWDKICRTEDKKYPALFREKTSNI
ncbi:MAG: sterol desaturase family protein [Bacteriovoracaceae bacterium]|nr:sterol desaturase family protein [Bacteriovoracaceae bacterium]